MTKSMKQLQDNLISLGHQVRELTEDLRNIYQDYLPHLIIVVKKQLMMATYQICTQKYPESFLRLTYSQKTNLQEKIKKLAHSFVEQLIINWEQVEFNNETLLQLQTIVKEILLSNQSSLEEEQESIIELFKNQDLILNDHHLNLSPEVVIKLQVELDEAIEECLINLSNATNKYLLEVNILPSKIPHQLLAIALQAEENTSIVSGAPNLLSILIEKEPKSEEDLANLKPIIAICLRINDLEFHDSALNFLRQKIVKILSKLDNLESKYQDLKEQYLIAQAEAAWRSSWYE